MITWSNSDENIALKRKCLALITRIAARGASSLDPDDVNVALQELAYLLNQWCRSDDLRQLHGELEWFRPTSDGLTAFDMLDFAIRSTWN
jgi:hypothetical protein